MLPLLTNSDLRRMYSKITADSSNKCWLWTGTTTASNHPVIRVQKTNLYVHRLVFKHLKDEFFDESLCVCHSCDNPRCVNPDHLFLGTHVDNMKDKVSKNRQSKGEMQSKLSEEQVIKIRELYNTTNITQRSISRRFKINQSQVSRIVSGCRWRHNFQKLA